MKRKTFRASSSGHRDKPGALTHALRHYIEEKITLKRARKYQPDDDWRVDVNDWIDQNGRFRLPPAPKQSARPVSLNKRSK